jgi:hypothetical protein
MTNIRIMIITKIRIFFALFLFLSFGFCLNASAQIGVRVLLGLTDESSNVWDGSITAEGAQITRLDPWRFGKTDEIHPDNSWKISTAEVLSSFHLIARQKAPIGNAGEI